MYSAGFGLARTSHLSKGLFGFGGAVWQEPAALAGGELPARQHEHRRGAAEARPEEALEQGVPRLPAVAARVRPAGVDATDLCTIGPNMTLTLELHSTSLVAGWQHVQRPHCRGTPYSPHKVHSNRFVPIPGFSGTGVVGPV